MKESNLFVFIIVALIVMAVLALAVLLLFNVSQKRILKEVTLRQEREIEFSKELLKNSLEAQESERNRIARDLHDGVSSKLNVIHLNFNLLKSVDLDPEKKQEILNSIDLSLKQSIDLSREISHDLIPPSFTKFGIQEALDSLFIQINQSKELHVNFASDHRWEGLSKMNALHVFRIVQELINNTVKHAQASVINVSSQLQDSILKLNYEDNGIGISDYGKYRSGIGLKNIKARAKVLNGKIMLPENSSKGFFFELKVPLKQ